MVINRLKTPCTVCGNQSDELTIAESTDDYIFICPLRLELHGEAVTGNA